MQAKQLPAIRILEAGESTNLKFKPTWNFADMNAENLTAFIEGYLKKDKNVAIPYLKTEDAPEKND